MTDPNSGVGRQLRAKARRERWFNDPALFARECIEWPDGTPYVENVHDCIAKGRAVWPWRRSA